MRPHRTWLPALAAALLLVVAGCDRSAAPDGETAPDVGMPDAETIAGDTDPDFDVVAHFSDVPADGPSPLGLFQPAVRIADGDVFQPFAVLWDIFTPEPADAPDREWVNKDALWDAVVWQTWQDALERYGDRIAPEVTQVHPGDANYTSAFAGVYGSHVHAPDGAGTLLVTMVGLEPEDPEQRYQDVAHYYHYVDGAAEDTATPTGTLRKTAEPCVLDGALGTDPDGDNRLPDAVDDCLADVTWPTPDTER